MEVLVLLTAKDRITCRDGHTHPTGYWLEELAVPLLELEAAGAEVSLATPGGVRPTPDPLSLMIWGSRRHRLGAALTLAERPELGRPLTLEDLRPADLYRYECLLVPGGRGPMEDLCVSPHAAAVLAHFHARGGTTAMIGHGPAALLSASFEGEWPYRGYRMTGFTAAEERESPWAGKLRWLLEDELRRLGAVVEAGAPGRPFHVEDRELLTAQNLASVEAFSRALLRRLERRAVRS